MGLYIRCQLCGKHSVWVPVMFEDVLCSDCERFADRQRKLGLVTVGEIRDAYQKAMVSRK